MPPLVLALLVALVAAAVPDLQTLSAKELRAYAREHGVDLTGCLETVDIRARIQQHLAAGPGASRLAPAVTEDNFRELVLDSRKHALVHFYSPRHAASKALRPIFGELAARYTAANTFVGEVDVADQQELALRFDVQDFPAVRYFSPANKDGIAYFGGRTLENFIRYLNQKSGNDIPATAATEAAPQHPQDPPTQPARTDKPAAAAAKEPAEAAPPQRSNGDILAELQRKYAGQPLSDTIAERAERILAALREPKTDGRRAEQTSSAPPAAASPPTRDAPPSRHTGQAEPAPSDAAKLRAELSEIAAALKQQLAANRELLDRVDRLSAALGDAAA